MAQVRVDQRDVGAECGEDATLPAPSILTERPRADVDTMTARQIAADANTLIWPKSPASAARTNRRGEDQEDGHGCLSGLSLHRKDTVGRSRESSRKIFTVSKLMR
jgi:hypothetical protein